MIKRLSRLSAALLLMVAILIPSASGLAQNTLAPQVNTNATFQVILADAALSTNVDVWVDGVLTAESGTKAVKPLSASGFITVTGASHTITLTQTGNTTQVAAPFTFVFPPGPHSDTSVILLPDLSFITIADDDTHPAPFQATVRVINLSPSNNPVDVTVDAAAPSTYVGVAYQAASPTYIGFAAGVPHTITIPGTSATLTKNFIVGDVYSIIVFWTGTAPKLYLSTEFSFFKIYGYLPMIMK